MFRYKKSITPLIHHTHHTTQCCIHRPVRPFITRLLYCTYLYYKPMLCCFLHGTGSLCPTVTVTCCDRSEQLTCNLTKAKDKKKSRYCFENMAHNSPLVIRLVASSVKVAKRAGSIIRNVMSQGDLKIFEKGKNDFQTEADRSAQLCIIKSLEKQFPSVSIIGEEEQSSCNAPNEWIVTESEPEILSLECPEELKNVKEEEVVVWVDPLDGTFEYTQGLVDHVTVLIGIAVGDRSVAGVIHQPYYKCENNSNSLGRTLWGIRGIGFGGFQSQVAPTGQRIIVTTRSHITPEVHDVMAALQPAQVMYVCGAGYKVVLLLEGKAHAYVFPSTGCKRWDTCAPEAVLAAAGGKLTDVNGHEYNYSKDTMFMNSYGIVATGAEQDHEWYLRKIPVGIRKQFT